MSGGPSLNVAPELRERIEQLAREREENPSTLIASALDLMLEAEARQEEEVRQRLASRTGKTIPHKRVSAWLETWGLAGEAPPPKCK